MNITEKIMSFVLLDQLVDKVLTHKPLVSRQTRKAPSLENQNISPPFLGCFVCGDSIEIMQKIPNESIDLI